MIIFGSVRFLLKKSNQTEIFFLKKNRTRTETGSNRPVSVRFGVFRAKTGSNRFGSVFPVLARFSRFWLGFFRFWLGFFRFGLVFSVWLGFGSVFPVWLSCFSGFLSVSVRFFRFFVYKTETEPNRPVF